MIQKTEICEKCKYIHIPPDCTPCYECIMFTIDEPDETHPAFFTPVKKKGEQK